jgi:hypothetical protein
MIKLFLKIEVFIKILVVYLGFTLTGFGQLNIEFPKSRAVFQRANDNTGSIKLFGICSKDANLIEGRLVPVIEGQGTLTDWQSIDSDIKDGTYSGQINGTGGWYNVEVRAMKNGVFKSLAVVNKIGIGEVFIVAGQSNAQGLLMFQPNGSKDDRVNAYSYYNATSIEENPPISEFLHIDKELNIGPHGQSAWAWGELGDFLANKWNVPILFFNTAYEGTDISNWELSSKGLPVIHAGPKTELTENTPYSFLRIILQNHASVYGLRSILWIQGENDFNTARVDYKNSLSFLISKVNQDTGKNINWVLAKTSLVFNTKHEQILLAQNDVISEYSNVYSGPFTDNIQVPRTDGVHFSYSGITELASSFNTTLSDVLIFSMNPSLAQNIEKLNSNCSLDIVRVATKSNFKEYLWSNGSKNGFVDLKSGNISGKVRDSLGNYHLTELLNVDKVFPDRPTVSAANEGKACEGKPVVFFTDRKDFQVKWQDGSTNLTFESRDGKAVNAIYTDTKGCKSAESNSVTAFFAANPTAPSINSLTGTIGACEGDGGLRLRTEPLSSGYRWSSGQETRDIDIQSVGKRAYTVKVISSEGCESPLSLPMEVEIFPKPVSPIIGQTGPYSLGVLNSGNFTKFQWSFQGFNDLAEKDSEIWIEKNGFYAVKGIVEHELPFFTTCISNGSGLLEYLKASDQRGIQVYPNPVVNKEVYFTSDVSTNVSITIKDYLGRTILTFFRISNLTAPRKITLPDSFVSGSYIMQVNYDGLQKRYKLFLE